MAQALGGGGGGAPGRDADSFYVEDCRLVRDGTQAVQSLVGQISRMVGRLETEERLQNCRRLVDDAVLRASETQTLLGRIKEHQRQAESASERSDRRLMYHRLCDDLAVTARAFEATVRRFSSEEQRRLASCQGGEVSLLGGLHRPRAADEPGAVAEADACCGGAAADASPTGERADAATGLWGEDCEDARCLKQIYEDLSGAAGDQQASLDALEGQMAALALDLELGGGGSRQGAGACCARQPLTRRAWVTTGVVLACLSASLLLLSPTS